MEKDISCIIFILYIGIFARLQIFPFTIFIISILVHIGNLNLRTRSHINEAIYKIPCKATGGLHNNHQPTIISKLKISIYIKVIHLFTVNNRRHQEVSRIINQHISVIIIIGDNDSVLWQRRYIRNRKIRRNLRN